MYVYTHTHTKVTPRALNPDLQPSQLAEYYLHELRRQMGTQQRVRPPQDKLVDKSAKLAGTRVSQLFFFVTGIRLAASENGVHVGAAEARRSAKNTRVCEIHHRVEFL